VLSRHPGEAVVVGKPSDHWIITVLAAQPSRASLRIDHSNGLESRNADLMQDFPVHIGTSVQVQLVDVHEEGDPIRIGIIAPVTSPVHRLEVWDALHPDDRRNLELLGGTGEW
jgi:sRNA-binding carbon storage regulator CsrA